MAQRAQVSLSRYNDRSGRRRMAHAAPTLATTGCSGTFISAMAAPLRPPLRSITSYGPLGAIGGELSRLFAPDAPHPAAAPGRYDSPTKPERTLALAVLKSAIHDLNSPCVSPRWRDDARAFVESRAVDWPYAFERLCDALGFEPATLRAGILDAVADRRINLLALAHIGVDGDGPPLGSQNRRAGRAA